MQVLRTLFWVLVAVLVVVFANNNWVNVTISLWSGLSLSINLPFLILVSFLIGFLPTFLWYRAIRWRLSSRLATAERERVAAHTPAERDDAPAIPPPEPAPPALSAPTPPTAPPPATTP